MPAFMLLIVQVHREGIRRPALYGWLAPGLAKEEAPGAVAHVENHAALASFRQVGQHFCDSSSIMGTAPRYICVDMSPGRSFFNTSS